MIMEIYIRKYSKLLFLTILFFIYSDIAFGQPLENINLGTIDSNVVTQKIEIQSSLASSERIYLEAIVSPIGGALVAVPGFYIGGILTAPFNDHYRSDNTLLAGIFIGALLGHSIGSAISVYQFERKGPNKVSFGGTLISSIIGSAMSVGVLGITGGDLWNNELGIIALISFPTIASIIYSNLIAQKKHQENISYRIPSNKLLIKTGLSHKDYYNSKKVVDLELMRINF